MISGRDREVLRMQGLLGEPFVRPSSLYDGVRSVPVSIGGREEVVEIDPDYGPKVSAADGSSAYMCMRFLNTGGAAPNDKTGDYNCGRFKKKWNQMTSTEQKVFVHIAAKKNRLFRECSGQEDPAPEQGRTRYKPPNKVRTDQDPAAVKADQDPAPAQGRTRHKPPRKEPAVRADQDPAAVKAGQEPAPEQGRTRDKPPTTESAARTDQDPAAVNADQDRPSTRAAVEEPAREGERPGPDRPTGAGPDQGRTSRTPPGEEPAARSDQGAPAGGGDAEQVEPARGVSQAVKDMIKARCDKELARPPYEWKWIDQKLVMENAERVGKGAIYGLEFPWNEKTLNQFGPAWLTKAFHTAGTMPEDNKVTKIILERRIKVTTGNNGGKFLFEVRYEKPSPGLHTKLFAKVPFPLAGKTKMDRISSSVNKQPAELYEINAYRYLEATLPMKTPRFYFGDISNETSNWIIITERIAFHDFGGVNFGPPGPTPDPLPAYEIEGPYDKCLDRGNLRGRPEEYYLLLTRVGARMAGLAKAGGMGPEGLLRASFRASPDGGDPMAWGMNPGGATGKPPRQAKVLLDGAAAFCADTGRALFPGFVGSPAYQEKFRGTMMSANAYAAELNYWMHMDPDYVSLGHMNLNVDNAYFWRGADGTLDCGVLDWGGLGTSSYGGKLWWWYYCMDYEVFEEFLPQLLEAFAGEYAASGGPSIDTAELRRMVVAAAVQQMDGLVSAIPQIYKMCPKKEFATIKGRYDPRIALNVDDKSTIRLYLHCMNSIHRVIEEMGGDQVIKDFISEVYVAKFQQSPKSGAVING